MSRSRNRHILVTGAAGFVGARLCAWLTERGVDVRAAVRGEYVGDAVPGVRHLSVGSVDSSTDWHQALEGVDAVVHLAARAHVLRERATDPLAEFRRVNVAGTLRLVEAAASAGVRRMVFVSSIGVNGSVTVDRPFSEQDAPHPHSPYSVSKWEAEQGLWKIAGETGLEVVVVRAPLVYGSGVGGNMLRLLHWIRRGVPLPLAHVENRRSLVALDNLVDFLLRCIEHPNAQGETFLVSDGEDISTPELIGKLAKAMGCRARLFGVPVGMLTGLARLAGQKAACDRLCGSLQIDASHAHTILNWSPPVSVDQALGDTARWYLAHHCGEAAAL